MKLTAQTFDGMNINSVIEVTAIASWMDRSCHHPVTEASLASLIQDAQQSGQMNIYQQSGEIDGFDGTPLYTNGQLSVRELRLDGSAVWTR